MALVLADRVKETTTTTGTGTMNLSGAASGFQTFVSGVGNGNTTYYCITSGTNWEVGIGTVTSGSPATLSRTTILASSNSGSAITLSGTSTVFGDAPASLLTPAYPKVYKPTTTLSGFTNTPLGGGTPTLVDSPVGMYLTTGDNTGTFAYRTSPSTPYEWVGLFSANPVGEAKPFFGFSDGTKYHFIYCPKQQDSNAGQSLVIRFSALGTWAGTDATVNTGTHGDRAWMMIGDDGTNVYFKVSNDGYHFITIYSVAKASGYLGSSGYTRIVIGTSTTNAAVTVMSLDNGTGTLGVLQR